MNGTELKTALKRANMTQGELATRLGRSRSMVADWMRADEVPVDWLPLVCEVLGIEPQAEDGVETAIRLDARLTADDKENLLALLSAMRRRRGA